MQTQSSDKLVIRDAPVGLWVTGGVVAVSGVLMAVEFVLLGVEASGIVGAVTTALVGIVMLLLPSVLTLTADRERGLLTLRYRSLLKSSVKEYPLSELSSIEVERSQTSVSYRLALRLASGQHVPLRSYYSGGYASKAQKASQLAQFLGLPDAESRPVFPLAAQAGRAAGQGLDDGMAQQGVTNGVTWQAGASQGIGDTAAWRWLSSDFKLPGQFVCLLQKPKGSASFGGGGIGGKMGQLVFQQVLNMYGFGPADLPGLSSAGPVQGLASGVAEDFSSLTNDQASAQQVLNPWVVTPLVEWAEQNPLKTVQSAGTAGQLVVLFSPQGVYLKCMQSNNPAQAEALSQLGVDLVRAQGTSPAAA